MSIFDKEIFLPGFDDEWGPEPSIRAILVKYYQEVFSSERSEELAQQYIKAISSEIGEDA